MRSYHFEQIIDNWMHGAQQTLTDPHAQAGYKMNHFKHFKKLVVQTDLTQHERIIFTVEQFIMIQLNHINDSNHSYYRK